MKFSADSADNFDTDKSNLKELVKGNVKKNEKAKENQVSSERKLKQFNK